MLGESQDGGSTSSIGIAIAAACFAGAFLVAQLMVAQPGGVDPTTATLDTEAGTALDLIVRDAGRAAGGGAWATDPDLMTRFGLARDADPNFLDYAKIKALRNGTTATASNDAPDYPEVRTALGLDQGDFHLRSYPVMPGYDDPRWVKEQNGRLAYFARYSGASAPGSMASWANATADALNVSVAIRNDGTAHAIYIASIGLGVQATGDTIVSAERHTRLLAPGEVQTVWATFPKMSSYSPTPTGVKVDLTDAYGNVAVAASWVPGTPPTGSGGASFGPLLTAGESYYESGETVKFIGDHYEGDGTHLNNDQAGRFVLVGPNGREWVNQTVTLPKTKNAVYTYSCPNCTTVGNYTATLWDGGMKWKAVDAVHVSALEMFTEKKTLDPVAIREMGILSGLVANFNQVRYDQASAPHGDVFGDDSNGPSDLTAVLSRYTTLVIGSEVSQTALNAASTKYAIADWVQAGGNLVVLGTYNQQSRWLEPIYHAAQVTANGGISAPDPMHPILSAPNRLSYDRYLDRARAWEIKDDQPFTHVLSRGASGNSRDDTLAVSAPGAYNDGTVVLTSYMPGSLTEPQDDAEAARLMHNLLSQSHTMLFLDYGPPIPDGVPVGSAQRLVAVPHPNVPGAVVEVRLVMYRFS